MNHLCRVLYKSYKRHQMIVHQTSLRFTIYNRVLMSVGNEPASHEARAQSGSGSNRDGMCHVVLT